MNRPNENPTTLATADQLDSAIQDLHGMIDAARNLLLIGGPECHDGAVYILENADRRMAQEIVPALMRASAAERSQSRPALAAVDAPADGLHDAQQAAEGASLGLSRLDGMLAAMATSDSDEAQLRDCVFCAREMLQPIRDNARSALDLVTNHLRDPSDPAKLGN